MKLVRYLSWVASICECVCVDYVVNLVVQMWFTENRGTNIWYHSNTTGLEIFGRNNDDDKGLKCSDSFWDTQLFEICQLRFLSDVFSAYEKHSITHICVIYGKRNVRDGNNNMSEFNWKP